MTWVGRALAGGAGNQPPSVLGQVTHARHADVDPSLGKRARWGPGGGIRGRSSVDDQPAADLVGKRQEIVRNHVAFTPPVVLDARMKPWMPKVVEADPDTVRLVDRRWREYFPKG